ncbi:MAG: YqaJ viral recombinase family protein [Pusillimonas sp.]|nr:YqaJ viral recombinase family protein [Pusillimonas sp.]
MKELQVIQGSAEWVQARLKHFTASEAPAMMGASKKLTRNELLRLKATGNEREYSDWVQRNLFDKGHEFEANARVLVEEDIGEELYPITATDDEEWLLASMDGMTMLGTKLFEHKMYNPELAAAVRAGDLDPEYYWQLEQQLLVTGAEEVIFVVSDGTRDNWEQMTYKPVKGRAEKLIAGWKQFEKDLAEYEVVPEKPQPVGKTMESLPALRIELTGAVTASNLAEYKEHAFEVIQSINTDLQTDQDFADAEKTVKWCKDVEDRLDAAKQHALSQTASIDELFRTIDEISAETRTKRLELDRLVKAQKENRRLEIKTTAEASLKKHLDALNDRVQPVRFTVQADFAAAMKGKRTIATLQDAADTELARAKIDANQLADKIDANLKLIREAGHDFLFSDLQTLATKESDDLKMVIDARIAKHKADEQAKIDAKLEAEREKIRQEEQAKAVEQAAKPVEQTTKQVEQEAPKAAPSASTGLRTGGSLRPPAAKQTRPTDNQIIECLALNFRVHESKVIEWLLEMDLEAASSELESAF